MIGVLDEVRRALCRDGSHVVLVLDPPVDPEIAERIVERVRDSTRVKIAHLAGLDATRANLNLLAALGVAGDEPQPDLRALVELELLQKLQASLVLVIPDALAVEPEILRRLGDLSKTSGNVLRLALLAERDEGSKRDPVGRLVEALGTGAAKIELVDRPPHADAPPAAANTPMPPVVPETRLRRQRPIAVRAPFHGSPRGRNRAGSAAALALLLALAVPTLIFTKPSPSEPSGLGAQPRRPTPPVSRYEPPPVASKPAPSEAIAYQAVSPEPIVSTPVVPEPVVPTPLVPEPVESTPAHPVVEKPSLHKPAAPIQKAVAPATVRVNFNASPWAEIEVDGRSVGPTPIANLPLAAGVRSVRATFPDGRVVEDDLRIDEFQNRFRIE